MKKTQILRKNWEFQKIIKNKKQVISKYLIVYFQKNEESLRIGISISKKTLNAVHRNLIRRKIRKLIDNNIDFIKIKYNVVLIIRAPYITINNQDKKKHLINIFKKLERIKNGKKSKKQ